MTCNIFSEQKDKLFNYKFFFIFCTLLHQGATKFCSIITNENRLKMKKKLRTNTWIHCLLAKCTRGAKMCNLGSSFLFVYVCSATQTGEEATK